MGDRKIKLADALLMPILEVTSSNFCKSDESKDTSYFKYQIYSLVQTSKRVCKDKNL